MHPVLEKLREDNIEKIKLGIFDVDGVMRGKYINMKKFSSAIEKGFGFCDVIFGWDLADELYAHGVRTVFVFTGGAISAIIDA